MQDLIFETERLYVHRYTPSDEDNFFQLNSDQDVMRYIRAVADREESAHFLDINIKAYSINPLVGRWAVRARDDGRFVGTFAILPMANTDDWQVGYALLKSEWGKGFASELLETGKAYAFSRMLLPRLMAVTELSNTASINVLEKAGFRQLPNISEDGKELCLFEIMNQAVIETDRLLLAALEPEQLVLYLLEDGELERQLGLRQFPRIVSVNLRRMLDEYTLPAICNANKHDYLFYTIWIIIDKTNNQMVGEFGFKGIPNERGEVEIGYAIFPEFQGRGYMKEAVAGIIDWCMQNPAIRTVLATTDKLNTASQAVLSKNQFQLQKEEAGQFIWVRSL